MNPRPRLVDPTELTSAGPVNAMPLGPAPGERTLSELSTLIGYCGTPALQLRVFAVPAPPA
ncbi:hypothetical protein ABZ464_09810 [Streptomyces sp. NPDC005820]|uniref:hypothetical protein n=1 Tax=Streptomyces sp. NPDC005820 TaxID=3157069 RepID=UPI0033DEDD0D